MGKIRESMLRMREQMHKIMQTSDAKGGKMDGSMQRKAQRNAPYRIRQMLPCYKLRPLSVSKLNRR